MINEYAIRDKVTSWTDAERDELPRVINKNGEDYANCPSCRNYNAMMPDTAYVTKWNVPQSEPFHYNYCRDCGTVAIVLNTLTEDELGEELRGVIAEAMAQTDTSTPRTREEMLYEFVQKCQWLCQGDRQYDYATEVNGVIAEARQLIAELPMGLNEPAKVKTADGLPEFCYTFVAGQGCIGKIDKGTTGYTQVEIAGTAVEKRELVDKLNETAGVSHAQRTAMEIGSMWGWECKGADPKTHEPKTSRELLGGEPRRYVRGIDSDEELVKAIGCYWDDIYGTEKGTLSVLVYPCGGYIEELPTYQIHINNSIFECKLLTDAEDCLVREWGDELGIETGNGGAK